MEGSLCGVWRRLGQHNSRPYYKLHHTLETECDWFLYSDGSDGKLFSGGWRVSSTLGKNGGSLENRANTDHVPVSGWSYYGGGAWHDDLLLQVTPVSDLAPLLCSSVTISATGEAVQYQSDSLGTFTPTGDFSCGRQVFKHETSGRYLLVSPGTCNWWVTMSVTETAGSIESGCAPDLSPDSPRAGYSERANRSYWQYADGNNGWLDDRQP